MLLVTKRTKLLFTGSLSENWPCLLLTDKLLTNHHVILRQESVSVHVVQLFIYIIFQYLSSILETVHKSPFWFRNTLTDSNEILVRKKVRLH